MKTLYWLPRIFAWLGVGLLAIGTYLYMREAAFVRRAEHATGTVARLVYVSGKNGGSYLPIVDFQTRDGRTIEFRSNVSSNPPSHHEGESVGVLYDPANPQHASLDSFETLHIGSFVLSLLGVIFGLIGGIWLYINARGEAKEADLRARGRRVEAKVTQIEYRTNYTVNNQHPYRIIAQAGDNVYKSKNIWFDPTAQVKETVTVFVDPNDPSRHFVDLDFLQST